MSKTGSINFELNVDTKDFERQLKKLMGWRVRFGGFLLRIGAKLIGAKIEIKYELKQVK